GTTVALDGIDLTVDHGDVFGLLGPNGAGKTTFCEILEGHRLREEGEVEVLGYDPADGRQEFKDRIGVVLQEAGHPPTMTVIEAVRVFSAAYPHPRQPEEILEFVGLSEKVKARVKTLSGGQKRRLDLALGIAGDPDLIFLDEPTTGFDPSARRRSWELVANLRKLGKTILLTTHYMDEAQTPRRPGGRRSRRAHRRRGGARDHRWPRRCERNRGVPPAAGDGPILHPAPPERRPRHRCRRPHPVHHRDADQGPRSPHRLG